MISEEEHRRAKQEALERTSVLANERTYAAWVRTGLTSLATSIGIMGLLQNILPRVPLHLMALTMGLASAAFFSIAAWRYHHVGTRMVTTNVSGAPIWLLIGISAALVLATFFSIAQFWLST